MSPPSWINPAVLLLLAASAHHAHAQDAPKRKPGLWEQTISSTAGAPAPYSTRMSMCTDHTTERLVSDRSGGTERCAQDALRREGGAVVVEATCRTERSTVRIRGRFTGDFNTQYKGEIHSTFDPPMQGMREMRQTMEARWVGPCRPGQKPGEVMLEGMPGGVTVQDMMGADPAKMQELMQKLQQMYPQGKPAR